MTDRHQRPGEAGMGRLVLGAILFSLLAPAPFVALPLAVLLVMSGGRSRGETFTAALAGGVSLAWLIQAGALPDQVVRAATVLVTAGFVLASRFSRLSFTHRAVLAVGTATLAIVVLFGALGQTWGELAWWVRFRTGYENRLAVGQLRGITGGSGALDEQLDRWVSLSTDFAAACFPALLALQLLVGLGLATALYHRISTRPFGTPLGRLSDFRFTEHLGWAAAIPLLIILIPRFAAAKVAAANLLLVVGALYGLRGLAVATFGAGLAGNTTLTMALIIGAAFLMLPVMIAGAVLLGVVDAGLDLRRRWTRPPASN